jgi:HEPN domain-containing protein
MYGGHEIFSLILIAWIDILIIDKNFKKQLNCMDRGSFQKIVRLRVREARLLLDSEEYAGAYYLIGYAIECALKSCVAKQVRRFDFPDKKIATEAFTHDLEKLLKVAGLSFEFESNCRSNPSLELNWAIVKDWTESSRYEIGITQSQARDLYYACVGKHGVLSWIKKKW